MHEAVVAHHITGRLALDLRPDDVFWCTADPGWVTGTSYGIISPLTNGATLIVDQAEFDAERWYRILQDQKITVWYTAPTAIRMLMKAGAEVAQRFDLSNLRLLASVGEPLNPEAVVWGFEAFGKPFHDNWWQTETGGIMISNYPSMDVKPGSMGRPLPGITAGIVERLPGGTVREISEPMAVGELALRPGWPSMMRAYLNEEERYRKCFAGGWYLTGDLAMRDDEGYYWFVGRADDVIKSAGHLIGPFEVESALMEHAAVAEAGVIGIPEPTAGEMVKAFVALKNGCRAERGFAQGAARPRAGAPGPGRGAQGHSFPPEPAEDAQRQNHAPLAQGARARPARGRYLDARKRGAMTAITDKPRLSRAHALELLKQMIRIRRFEDKCAELYTQEKIRGFLHLYDGEEAVAVGVIPVLEPRDRIVATYREHGHALVRGVPMTTALGGNVRKAGGLQPRTRRLDAPVRSEHQLLRRQRHRRWRAAALGRACARRSACAARTPLRPAFSARAPSPKASFTRASISPRSGHCRCCSCARTTYTPWAQRWRYRNRKPTSSAKRHATGSHRKRSTAWTWSRWKPPRAAPSTRCARAASPYFLECRTYRLRATFHV